MIRFTIPALPALNTSGRRRHWAVQHKEAERWKWLVFGALVNQGHPGTPVRRYPPIRKARVVLTRQSSRQPDYDNLVASFKPVLDALVKNNVLAGDSPDVFECGHPDYQWRKGSSAVQVDVWPL